MAVRLLNKTLILWLITVPEALHNQIRLEGKASFNFFSNLSNCIIMQIHIQYFKLALILLLALLSFTFYMMFKSHQLTQQINIELNSLRQILHRYERIQLRYDTTYHRLVHTRKELLQLETSTTTGIRHSRQSFSIEPLVPGLRAGTPLVEPQSELVEAPNSPWKGDDLLSTTYGGLRNKKYGCWGVSWVDLKGLVLFEHRSRGSRNYSFSKAEGSGNR